MSAILQDWVAEEYVIATMMMSPKAIDDALEVLEPRGEEKFTQTSLRIIYRAIKALHLDGQTVNEITLNAFLSSHLHIDKVAHGSLTGEERLRELALIVPAASPAKQYAEIVREHWSKRQVNAVVMGLKKLSDDGAFADAILDQAERDILNIRTKVERGGKSSMSRSIEMAIQVEDGMKNPPDINQGVPPPFHFLDNLQSGRMYVLAGYTADGKSILAMQYAKSAAKRGYSVGYFTVEMDKEQLFDRFVSSFGIPFGLVESRRITPQYEQKYKDAISTLSSWKIDFIDDPLANAAMFHRFQRMRDYDLLIIDHLHEIVLQGKASEHRRMLEEEVGRIAVVAKSESVPVLLLAQLSRSVGGKPFPMPHLAMLRETARIEQEAHMVSFVYRERDEKNQPKDDAWFVVAKNRSGRSRRGPAKSAPSTAVRNR